VSLRRFCPTFSLIALLTASVVHAQGISASIDRTVVTPEDEFYLEVVVEGAQNVQLLLPDTDENFSWRAGGLRTHTVIANNQISTGETHTFVLFARKLGTLMIPPIEVEIDGQIYQSRPITISVMPASALPPERLSAFVLAEVSNSNPYVGEQVIFTFRFFRRPGMARNASIVSSSFGELSAEHLDQIRDSRQTVQGQQFEVSEVRRALFATASGRFVIPGWELSCQLVLRNRESPRRRRSFFDDPFGRQPVENRMLRTDPIELNVRPLPAAPERFSGLVGEFSVRSEVSKLELEVGQSLTQTITISGSGNAHMIPQLEAPVSEMDFKVYDDQAARQLDRSASGLEGSRSFPRALQPLRFGTLQVPAVELVYFDPKHGDYLQSLAVAIDLEVLPPSSPEELGLTESLAPTTGKVMVRILADDILPIRRELDAVTDGGSRTGLRVGVLVTPPVAFLALFVFARRRRRLLADDGLRRRSRALPNARSRLAGASTLSSEELSLTLRHYVGDRIGTEGAALTAAECVDLIEAEGAELELVAEAGDLLRRLEAASYGSGSSRRGVVEVNEVVETIERLERSLS
jgi:hypothetical protein